MAGKNDKWLMFRNYMHNELGITKADIREWIEDAIKDQVKLIVSNTYKSCDIEGMMKKAILNEYNNSYGTISLKDRVAKFIVDNIELKVKN